jgi:putative endonuclease
MPWYVYILQCGDGSFYTGISTDPERRLEVHNAGRGSKYVNRKGGAVLVYTEPLADKSRARRRELEIQSWTRQKKLALIRAHHARRAARI